MLTPPRFAKPRKDYCSIRAGDNSTHQPLLVAANEVSGTTTVYEISRMDK